MSEQINEERQLCVTLTLGEKKKPPGFRVSLDSQLSPETQEDSGMWLPLINPSVIDCPGSVRKCTQTHIYIWRQHAILSPCPLTPVRPFFFLQLSLCLQQVLCALFKLCRVCRLSVGKRHPFNGTNT